MDPACRCLPFPFTFSVQKEYVFRQSQPQSPPPTPRVVLSSFVLSPDFFSRTKSKSAAVPTFELEDWFKDHTTETSTRRR